MDVVTDRRRTLYFCICMIWEPAVWYPEVRMPTGTYTLSVMSSSSILNQLGFLCRVRLARSRLDTPAPGQKKQRGAVHAWYVMNPQLSVQTRCPAMGSSSSRESWSCVGWARRSTCARGIPF